MLKEKEYVHPCFVYRGKFDDKSVFRFLQKCDMKEHSNLYCVLRR